MTALLAAPLPVVVRPAPAYEPPFDDELPEYCIRPGRHDQRLPFERPAVLPRAWPIRPVRPSTLPDPVQWARRLLIGMIETAGGRRPLQQLASMLSPSVCRGLGADFERTAHASDPHWLHRATLRSVRGTQPCDGVAELCATVDTGRRVRAIALRLEAHHGRWRCTRLQLG